MRFSKSVPLLLVALLSSISIAPAFNKETGEAVGRLNYAGYKKRQHCTAFLVAPNVAMTAAHCIEGLEPAEVHLLLGYDRGNWREHLRATRFWRSPDGEDLAALCLASPARATPLSLQTVVEEQNQQVAILGYGLPSRHRMSQKTCRIKALSPRGALLLDCPVTQGTSGGPVLSPQRSAVVAVISATTKNESLAISVPPIDLAKLCS